MSFTPLDPVAYRRQLVGQPEPFTLDRHKDAKQHCGHCATGPGVDVSHSTTPWPEVPAFARSGTSNPLGKLYPIKVNLAMASHDELHRLASEVGMPVSEYLRVLIEARLHGPDHAAKVAADRVRRVLSMGTGIGSTTNEVEA